MKSALARSKREMKMIIKRESHSTFPASGTSFYYSGTVVSTSTGVERSAIADPLPPRSTKPSDKVIAKAVENHLRFLRSKGRVTVSAEEVARALSLPVEDIERVAGRLSGVRVER